MNKDLVKTVKTNEGEEVIQIRVDKTIKDLMDEKPVGRWDAKYWSPKFDKIYSQLEESPYHLTLMEKFIKSITYGSTKPRDYSKEETGMDYIRSVNVLFTGLDSVNLPKITPGGRLDGENFRVNLGDVVMNKCGTGTAGRLFAYYGEKTLVVSQHTMLIRFNMLNPAFFVVFMNTAFGASQFEQYDKGTSGQTHIDFEDIKAIKVPDVPEIVQKHIEDKYLEMSKYHEVAMEAKSNSIEVDYKRNLGMAKDKLKDLVTKTEAVIRGEREDVI